MSNYKYQINTHTCTECKYSETQCLCIWGKLRDIYQILSDLSEHINKIHDMVNLDDRITGKAVLDRVEILENNRKHSFHDRKEIREITNNLHERLSELEEWSRKDEDSVYSKIKEIETRLDFVYKSIGEKEKKPYKCPICEGTTFCSEGMMCVPCDGEGIVWG